MEWKWDETNEKGKNRRIVLEKEKLQNNNYNCGIFRSTNKHAIWNNELNYIRAAAQQEQYERKTVVFCDCRMRNWIIYNTPYIPLNNNTRMQRSTVRYNPASQLARMENQKDEEFSKNSHKHKLSLAEHRSWCCME